MEGLDAAEHVVRFLQALHRYVIQRYFLQGGIYRSVQHVGMGADETLHLFGGQAFRRDFCLLVEPSHEQHPSGFQGGELHFVFRFVFFLSRQFQYFGVPLMQPLIIIGA